MARRPNIVLNAADIESSSVSFDACRCLALFCRLEFFSPGACIYQALQEYAFGRVGASVDPGVDRDVFNRKIRCLINVVSINASFLLPKTRAPS